MNELKNRLEKDIKTSNIKDVSLATRNGTSSIGIQVESSNIAFQCSICFELAYSPVVTKCGHLYCFKCIKSWFDINYKLTCPVCKVNSGFNQLIPIYTNFDEKHDFDSKLPEIPQEEYNHRNRPNRNPFQHFNPFSGYMNNADHDFVFYFNGIPVHTSSRGGLLLLWGVVILFFVIALPF
eukprot:NODE_56_length_25944_cov_0.235287.p12 type:complete len:180 gc:universal NODE_56_length_25944_cov_0.235287:468-1007(+)